jgi:AcrR family transcriptional regulator
MLAEGGPDAVRVEPLASALGVTKGGFYGQFADRQALLDAMLDTWEQEAIDEAIRDLPEGGGDDARANIRAAGVATFSEGWLRPIDLAVRDWARRDPAVAQRLRRVDERRMDFLRSQFSILCADPEEAEARSLLAFCLAVGHDLVAPDLPGKRRVLDVAMTILTD